MSSKRFEARVKFSAAVYAKLLRAYPKAFREKYGREMAQVFRKKCADTLVGTGKFDLTKLWWHTLFDLAKSCPNEHIAALGGNMIMFKQTLLTRLWLAPLLAFLLVGCASAFVSARLLPQYYQSYVRFTLFEKPRRVLAGGTNCDFPAFWLQTQFELMRSPQVLNPVIDKLSLNRRWAAREGYEQPFSQSETLNRLRNRIINRVVNGTTLFEIRVMDVNAKEAAEIANEIATTYLRVWTELHSEGLNQSQKDAAAKTDKTSQSLQDGSSDQVKDGVAIVDQAEPALRPVWPNVPAATVGGGMSAAFVSLVLVFVARRFCKTVPSLDETAGA